MDELEAADVCVLPSLIEGFGLTAIEAMSVGTAVIVSNHTFADDLISHGHNGFVVPPRDSSNIASLLRDLEEDRRLPREIGQRGQAAVAGRSWEHYGDAFLAQVQNARSRAGDRWTSS